MVDVLSRDFARKRKEMIGEVQYDLSLDFGRKKKGYKGKCVIDFDLLKKSELKIDTISKVRKVVLNGKKVKVEKGDSFILLGKEDLEKGRNVAEIEYSAEYDHTGDGLHQFIDPEDGSEYLYSNFEPYDAHRMFPCFDQPDIKATYKLKVRGPREWKVISNGWESEKRDGEFIMNEFAKTKKLSTYLFHLSAGPYVSFEDNYKGMKIRIFCRKSVKKWVRANEMFKITKQGLDYYSKYFDYSYPFDKYDQIFVPEFNSGAMENAGAITFSEHYLVRREPTRVERYQLAEVILHEMVHMWFGDLVTMKWWDDLWLNESFADFLSYLCSVNATEFKDGWQNFYARKAWAYYQDQLVTTHPIAADASDTDVAFSNFDGISYSKGASVLKQLLYYIGEDSFREGVRTYFKKHAWSNTELSDFLGSLEKAYGKPLEKWFDSWIRTTGVNSVRAEYSIENGKISSFSLIQEASSGNNLLREHKSKIGLFYNGDVEEVDVSYSGRKTIVNELVGRKSPDFVFVNYKDYDYVKNGFDSLSMDFVLDNVWNVKDDLTRQMVYGSLWQMVRDAELDPRRFLDLVLVGSKKEKILVNLERMILRSSVILNQFVTDEVYREYSEKFLDLAKERLYSSSVGREMKESWFSLLMVSSPGVGDDTEILRLLSGLKIKNLELDQDKRWRILTRLAALGNSNIDKFVKREKLRDKSDKGMKAAATVMASKIGEKEKIWGISVRGENKSLDYARSAMAGFYWRNQKKELVKYADLFFDDVGKVYESKDRRYAEAFFNHLFPSLFVETKVVGRAKMFLKEKKDIPELLRKGMLEGIDDMERGLKILRKFS